ncbi:Guanine nucleotide exchange factor LTE1 [Wickerhamomyces ciferrii]|uniref:Guanine nucleotide exchange factor LTE1 n=1 Tax=Wickerhamomyces ciferrii (strain ATCC 14091 / BCRC 22168 / CBS 111 / JCM 3599 / NBRC 0793 / NRRL Y-1031 F-60-10) TaxID=1206466 RepID=K0KYT5_WICCF|nr:Guanine nucleotide exchange factor LTE1 [Wickerhamomyces ciferrii]CCH46243.1 Guanine nucleotide exchange factor LTE1 [Wickerhamomyces ciferrii]
MTDLIDYQVHSLDLANFDTIVQDQSLSYKPSPLKNQIQNAEQQPQQQSPPSSPNSPNSHVDIITLINILTSPSEIDYQIVSDFFLTYRSFISQSSLLQLLILKLQWSLKQIEDTSHETRQNIGKLSLVRTFVVIRHWLLNYFADDFIPFVELREIFINAINSIKSTDLFVTRIISKIKGHWTYCCNKSWNEDINPDSFDNFDLKIGPQKTSTKAKRLSTFAINQQRDPMIRNSIVLSTFDQKTIHKLPIPIPNKQAKPAPKQFLNPKNSNLRLSRAILTDPKTQNLYIPLTSPTNTNFNTIRGATDFPKDPKPTKFIPPTPVKKMEVKVQLPNPPKNQTPNSKGLRPLFENWLKTFHLHNSKHKSKDNNEHVEKFMRSVVSVARPDNESLLKLTLDKFDILSARTIDELEYLVKFHNELLNKHGANFSPVNESFSFTIDEQNQSKNQLQNTVSNIDNMNICECITNINKSVLSFQHKFSEGDDKSYISYDSTMSRENNQQKLEDDGFIKKKVGIENLREFNFENDKPRSIISESTIPMDPSDQKEEQKERETIQKAETEVNNEPLTPVSSGDMNKPESNHVEQQSSPKPESNHIEQSSSEAEVSHEEKVEVEAKSETEAESVIQSTPNAKDSQETIDQTPSIQEDESIEKSRPVSSNSANTDSDYDEIESFVSTYEDAEDIENGEVGNGITANDSNPKDTPEYLEPTNNDIIPANSLSESDHIEPTTPPAIDGIISSTPHISPIKSIMESDEEIEEEDHVSPLKQKSLLNMTVRSPKSEKFDLNRIPSFNQVSRAEKHLSYLSRRSNRSYISYDSTRSKPQVSDSSANSIFSNAKRQNQIVMIPGSESINDDSVHSVNNVDQAKQKLMKQDEESIRLVESSDFAIPYPGVDPDAIAELAAISDDSFQSDPINAALLKLEGSYQKNVSKKTKTADSSIDSKELERQVDDLNVKSARNSIFIDQRRKTRMFSLTPVKQKPISIQSSSKLLLELLINHKINNEVLSISNNVNHISFILNFNSKTLAEQFTLIEKDCLLEIDWKELIELKWEFNNIVSINSWLELLIQNQTIQGIDLCISRFNLTVNWIISEILLTKDITLRKLTIQRFIHIAQNCYQLQNFSTLMEILLALGSGKVLKLKNTWRIIEPGDILIYKNLERISSPFRNFANLRGELNNIKPSKGCVPFLGLYLSDLIFNKERSSIRGKLINFNKFRTDAKIVKSLIQCVQWSTLYKLDSDSEVLSKCLYIKALDEVEMNECLKDIEGTL